MKKKLFICGDIHGEIKQLIGSNLNKLKNSDIICVGDFGIGFGGPNSTNIMYDDIKKKLETNNINIYTIRGNHDNPEFFDGNHDYDRLKLLEDHKVYEIQGKTIYTIGGATSVDIDFPNEKGKTRRKINEELIRRGSRKRIWWPEERIIQKLEDLPKKVDYIISHEAPISFLPVIERDNYVSYETWNNIISERNYLQSITTLINSSWWFYGHYHNSYKDHYGNLLYKGLGINELFEINKDKY